MKVLDLTFPTPAENLACEEALLDAAEAGQSGEVLRFWESTVPFVVVGYANRVAAEVNVAACQARNIPILRRCSGGGTVLQGPGCLNYALVLRIAESGPTRSISTANQYIMERNRTAIASLHSPLSTLNPSVRGDTDLALDGRKFSGNAQRRRKHHLLFHGTFLLGFDLALISEVLRFPSQQPDYRDCRTHEDFLTQLDVSGESIKAALARAWQADRPLETVPHDRISALAREKYSTPEWNFKL
jgi:lipoate-protein ligase A